MNETVTVEGAAPLVNATTTDLSVVIANAKIDNLSLSGRNFQQLVGLQAGVVNSPATSVGGRGGIEFNGSPAFGNNLMLDGIDMSFGKKNGAGDTAAGTGGAGALINTVSVEAIEEFKATGSAFTAEYGRATGGVLNVTTKSGGNQFHGTLCEFFRNDKLDANSFFNNRSGLAKPPLRQNQYGGNLGGPIRRDRAFFFVNYEGATVRRASQICRQRSHAPAAFSSAVRDSRESRRSAEGVHTNDESTDALGRTVTVDTAPQSQWIGGLTAVGFPHQCAAPRRCVSMWRR